MNNVSRIVSSFLLFWQIMIISLLLIYSRLKLRSLITTITFHCCLMDSEKRSTHMNSLPDKVSMTCWSTEAQKSFLSFHNWSFQLKVRFLIFPSNPHALIWCKHIIEENWFIYWFGNGYFIRGWFIHPWQTYQSMLMECRIMMSEQSLDRHIYFCVKKAVFIHVLYPLSFRCTQYERPPGCVHHIESITTFSGVWWTGRRSPSTILQTNSANIELIQKQKW